VKKTIYLFLFLSISCNQQRVKPITAFIVPPDTMPVIKKWTDSEIPPPPPPNRAYYFASNFIFDTADRIYFYQQHQLLNDDAPISWDTAPNFIGLEPKDIIQIPGNSVEDFIKLNILNKGDNERYVAIASTRDTFTSNELSKIVSIFKFYRVHWKFRKVTQEEEVVLDCKKRQVFYIPNAIKWDSTKIIFR
jgi:hypothetical protein